MRKLTAALVAVALAVASTAAIAATPKSGKWKGKLTGNHSGKVTFKVSKSRKKLTRFEIPSVVIVCGSDIRVGAVGVPSAKISKSGKFRRTYKNTDPDPSLETTYKLKGRFKSATKASGTVNLKTTSCNVDLKFTAKKR